MNNNIISQKIKDEIIDLRKQGKGYKRIASILGITRDYVRNYCVKNGLAGEIASDFGNDICKTCGASFKKKAINQLYCCESCRAKKEIKKCVVCGNEVQKNRYKYCSDSCRKKNNQRIYEITCKHCNSNFITTSHGKRFCSEECKAKHHTKVCLGCGREFKSKDPNRQYCTVKCLNNSNSKSHYEFAKELLEVHKGMIVPLEQYRGSNYKIKCKCLGCGNTINRLARFYIGSYSRGCNVCVNRSKGELAIEKWLMDNHISYERQYGFDELRYAGKLHYDFAVFKNGVLKLLIEYDGIQHFKPVKAWGGEEKLQETIIRDEIKNNYANEINVPLLRISYKHKQNISNILKETLIKYKLLQAS